MNRNFNKPFFAAVTASIILLGQAHAQVISTTPSGGTTPGVGPKFGDTGITQSYLSVYGPANIVNLAVPEPTTTGVAVGVGLISMALVRAGLRNKRS